MNFACVCLCFYTVTTTVCSVVSKYLQSKEINISLATLHIQALISEIEKLCNCSEFDKFWLKAENVAKKLEVDYVEPRPRKISKRLDDHWQNETVLTGRDRYRTFFYYETLDIILTALRSRFSENVLSLLKSTDCLVSPSAHKIYTTKLIANFYLGAVENVAALISEYRLFINLLQQQDTVPLGVHSVYKYMSSAGHSAMCPNLAHLYRLSLTLPATSCSRECSFSALKFVKNALRTTKTQS